MTIAPHTDQSMTASDRQRHAIRWANRMLTPDVAVILDTETTDLGGDICEIAIIDTNGNTLLDTLVNPGSRGCWIHPEAHRVHGIDNSMLTGAPSIRTMLTDLLSITAGYRHVLTYNADFDSAVTFRAAHAAGLDLDHLADPGTWGCIMRARSESLGHPEHYLPLNGDHRALGDCFVALAVLRDIAATDQHAAA